MPVVVVFQLDAGGAPVDARDGELGAFFARVEPAAEIDVAGIVGAAKLHGLVAMVAGDDVVALTARLVDVAKIQNHFGMCHWEGVGAMGEKLLVSDCRDSEVCLAQNLLSLRIVSKVLRRERTPMSG